MQTPKRTALYDCHLDLKARIVEFAGYSMPVQYSGVLEETKAVRAACGLFDVSHMGQFSVRGTEPLKALQRLVTNDLSKIKLGQAQYNMLCNDDGGVIDDLIVYHRAPDEAYICVNAGNRQADFSWMQSRLPMGVTLTDESDQTSLIAVQGPRAAELLSEIVDPTLVKALKYYWAAETKVMGFPCYLSRTGYTGEDGFEIYLHAQNGSASDLWRQLLTTGKKWGTQPIGLGARDTLRLEMGYPLHGHELSTAITPLEAGLGWVVKTGLPTEFIGQKALQQQLLSGVKRRLHGFRLENEKRIPRQGYAILTASGQPAGEITSGSLSPHTGGPVAMGFVNEPLAESPLLVSVRNDHLPIIVNKLPFVPSRTLRGK